MSSLSIIIPVYNEEKNIAPLYERVVAVCNHHQYEYEVLFIDDGSTDKTSEEIKKLLDKEETGFNFKLQSRNPKLKYISFRKNFGQTAAMMAGIRHSTGDII